MSYNKIVLVLYFLIQTIGPSIDTNDICIETVSEKSCFCTECDYFDDCCVNKQKKPTNLTFSNYFECNVPIAGKEFFTYSISRCPKDSNLNNMFSLKCESTGVDSPENTIYDNILKYFPVFSTTTNLTYRNIFCAKCHLQDLKKMLFFDFVPINNQSKNIEDIINLFIKERQQFSYDIKSSLRFKINNTNLRECVSMIRTCPKDTPLSHVELCKNHTAIRYKNKIAYKNQYCALCNLVQLNEINHPHESRIIPDDSVHDLFDLNGLFEEMKYFQWKNEFGKNISNYLNFLMQKDSNETLPNRKNETRKTLEDKIKHYLTIVCLTISILSLFLLLTIYLMIKTLRNFAGKLLMSLSVSILFQQLFYLASILFSNPDKAVFKSNKLDLKEMLQPCYILGAFTYYLYLAVFFWSFLMAYDIFKMFCSLTSGKGDIFDDLDNQRNKFLIYSLIAWFFPLLIGAAFIIKEVYHYERLDNERTRTFSCFIPTRIDLFLFFVIPVGFLLIANLFFLIGSIVSIHKIDKSTKKIIKNKMSVKSRDFKENSVSKEKQEESRLTLFIRLFFLTGMNWFLALISAIFGQSFIWHIYIVVNSLQGFFIFLSFALNVQTKKEIKKSKLFHRLSLHFRPRHSNSYQDSKKNNMSSTKLIR